jgi:hypothetical protein
MLPQAQPNNQQALPAMKAALVNIGLVALAAGDVPRVQALTRLLSGEFIRHV